MTNEDQVFDKVLQKYSWSQVVSVDRASGEIELKVDSGGLEYKVTVKVDYLSAK